MRSFALASLLVSSLACGKKVDDAVTKAPPSPLQLSVFVAKPVASPKTLTLTGMITANQRSEVTADTQGKVLAVLVERGQRVKMGDPVVRLDVQNAALSAREAQANLEAARAQKGLAEEECRRTQALLDKGAITRSEYDRQSTQCTAALQQVSAAQARAELVTKSVADGLVRAPFAGVVTEKTVSPGEWVAPGRSLFTLVDDHPLKIELSVPEAELGKIHDKQEVILTTVANGCWHYTATVSRIGGEIGRSRALIVEATIDAQNPKADEGEACTEIVKQPRADLVAGMFAEAQIVTGEEPHLVVPIDAIQQRGKLEHVFLVRNGELEDHIVQTGPAKESGMRAILVGLEADVINPVTPASEKAAAEKAGSGSAGSAAPPPPPAALEATVARKVAGNAKAIDGAKIEIVKS